MELYYPNHVCSLNGTAAFLDPFRSFDHAQRNPAKTLLYDTTTYKYNKQQLPLLWHSLSPLHRPAHSPLWRIGPIRKSRLCDMATLLPQPCSRCNIIAVWLSQGDKSDTKLVLDPSREPAGDVILPFSEIIIKKPSYISVSSACEVFSWKRSDKAKARRCHVA